MVSKLKDAIILSQLHEPKTSKEIAAAMRLGKSHVSKSLKNMKKSGLIRGRGHYFLTPKGKLHVDNAYKKINGSKL